jgi:Secretion system C-terminal sorting domain
MKNNKLSLYFLVLLFSTAFTSLMAQDVLIDSPFAWCTANDPATGNPLTTGNPSGGTYAAATSDGSNRLLVAMVCLEDGSSTNVGNTPTSVTYGGQEMTKVTQAFYNNPTGTDTYIAMYILKEAELASALGTDVVVAWSEPIGTAGEVNCAIFENVDQAQPIRAFANAANPLGTSGITTIETPAVRGNAGEIVLAGVATASGTGTWAWDNGFTSVFTGPGGFGRSLCGTKVGADADETPKVTGTGTSQARITMVSATLKKNGTPPLSLKDNKFAANAINIYPNPASDVLNIDSVSSSEKEISVFNSLGQIVSKTKSSGNAQIDLKSLNVSGFVIVQVIDDGQVSNHKVIVK